MSKKTALYILGFLCFAMSITEFIVVGLLDVIAASVGISVGAAGQLVTAYALAAAIGTPIAMMIFSKLSRRHIMMIALVFVAVGGALMALGLGFIPLLLARIIMAVGSGVFTVCCFSVASSLAEPGHEGGAIAIITTSFSAALVLGLPLGRTLVALIDWTTIFWIAAIIAMLSILIVLRLVQGGTGEAPMPLRKQFALLKNPLFLTTFGITFFWLGSYSIVFSYISPLIMSIVPIADTGLSVALLVLGVLTLVGNSMGGVLGDKLGARRAVFVSLAVQVIGLIALALAGGNTFLAIPALVLWAVSCWGPAAVQQLNVISLAPEASGVMLSLQNTITQVAYAAGAAMGGVALESTGIGSLAWVGAALGIIGIVTAYISARLALSQRQGTLRMSAETTESATA